MFHKKKISIKKKRNEQKKNEVLDEIAKEKEILNKKENDILP